MSRPPRTRVAVVGAGFIADFHLEILQSLPGVEVVAVCDRVKHRAESAARRFSVPKAVTAIDQLAGLGIRVCHLAVPPDLHASVARECLAAGLGVFCEKPLVLASAEARELARLARAQGVPLGVNHNALFHPAFAELRARVDAGAIGRVEHVRATLSVPLRQLDAGDFSHWMFREPRNIVFEQAVHPLAQVHALLGRVLQLETTILGTRELAPGVPFHDRWLLAARGERGTAEIYLSFGRSFTRHTLEVLGTDGSLEADLFHGACSGEAKTPWLDFWNSFLALWRRGGALRRSAARGLYHYVRQTLGLGPREDAFFAGMRDSLRAFHAALAEGRALPADGEAAAQVLEWCEAAVRGIEPARRATETAREPGPPRPGEVAVIGGTGFIGKRTVAKLLERGLPVTLIARRTSGLPRAIEEGVASGAIRLVRGSLDDAESLARGVRGASVVLQLATGGGTRWEDFERAMVGGTRAVAAACREAGARLVYVSSTAALYLGSDCGHAVVEDDVAPDPQPARRPLYARGKIAAEQALAELARGGLRVVVVRPGVVLGPDTPLQHSGLGLWVRDNHCVGWGLGEHPLPLVLADDVADALAAIAAHRGDELDGKSLNLCTRVPLSARDVVEAMRERTGRDLHFHPRALGASQVMELGKWLVKKAGRRKDAEFPSWRDLKSRALVPPFSARTAREVLGWKPVEERELFLARALGLPAPQQADGADATPLGASATLAARARTAAGPR